MVEPGDGGEDADVGEGTTRAVNETDSDRKKRLCKMESPALAIRSLSLQIPAADWVDYMIAAKHSFAMVWESLKSLYGVSSETDEMGVLETFGALRLDRP